MEDLVIARLLKARFHNIDKKPILLIIAISIYVLLHKLFEKLISKSIVHYLLSYIVSSWYTDIIFLIIIAYLIVFLIIKFKDYIPSFKILLSLIFCSSIYCYYRIFGEVWYFTPFKALPIIKYADLLICITTINILLYLVRKKNRNLNEFKNQLLSDIPISKNSQDELGYSNYAKQLSSKIEASFFEKSFAIGINGKWGQGKSSFINLLRGNLKSNNNIHIEFNPWNSQTPSAIIKDFFDTLQEKIRPYHSSLAGLLLKYGSKIVGLNDNDITSTIYNSATLISGYDSLSSLFDSINNALKDLSKKVIIYIDDLDRLDKAEIIEVIRLIRNTANFHNTYFIVAYDRNYIMHALSEHNPYNHEMFLEKIFQIEITLPYFKKDILIQKLAYGLKQTQQLKYHDDIEKAIFDISVYNTPYLSRWLHTIRDVTRLTNSIALNLSSLLGEVETKDFLKLEVLRLKYPAVYELLFRKRELFLQISNNSNSTYYKYQLINGGDSKEVTTDIEKKEKYIKIYLNKNLAQLGVPENEVNKIVDLIQDIFPDTVSYSFYKSNILSVAYPSKFDRYFAYNLLEGNLSELEFSKARSLDSAGFNKQITKWLDEGLAGDLTEKFLEIKAFDNKEDFEKIIKGIFHFASHDGPKNNYRLVIGYDSKDLQDKLGDYRNILSDNFYSEFEGKDGLKDFIKGLLNNAKTPYLFESEFVYNVLDKYFDETMFPLTKEDLKCISVDYLKKYCEINGKIDNTVFQLFWRTQFTNYIPTSGGTYRLEKILPNESKIIMKKFVSNDFDEFLLRLIEVDSIHQKSFYISRTVLSIYDSWNDFMVVLNYEDENKWKYLIEFKEFYQLALIDEFKNYISFDFKIIPIELKSQKH